jgi:putative peptidoglycan lipid II flippase
LHKGAVTEFELGLRVFYVPMTLLASSLVAPVAATWSRRFVDSGWPALRDSLSRLISIMLVILPPVVALGWVLRRDLIVFMYRGGKFTDAAIGRTADVLGMLMVGLPGQVLVVCLATLFLVRKSVIVPMCIAFANIGLNFGLNLVFRPSLGVAGIALATTLTTTVLCGVYAVEARRRFGALGLRPVIPAALGAGVSLLLTGTAASAVSGALPRSVTRGDALAAVLLATVAGLVVHSLVLLVTRNSDAEQQFRRLFRRRLAAR